MVLTEWPALHLVWGRDGGGAVWVILVDEAVVADGEAPEGFESEDPRFPDDRDGLRKPPSSW